MRNTCSSPCSKSATRRRCARSTPTGIDVPEVHAEVRRALGTGDDRLWEGILITPRVRRIIALAEERAGEREVGPIDLFEALRSEGGSSAAEILRRAAARNTASTVE